MSHGITTEIVPHTVHIAGNGYGDIKPWHILMLDPEQYSDYEYERLFEESDGEVDDEIVLGNLATLNGTEWTVSRKVSGEGWDYHEFNGIYATKVAKGDHIVYAINSSEYNNVGEFQITMIATEEAALVEFLDDLSGEHMFNIKSPGIAEQWG